ncbi:MAG: hypothetical protein IPG76_17240 [Acidobacteria bacterium]|nr:hypothetical protein [Acidobacteriota bacterium]
MFTLYTCRERYRACLQERRDAYQISHVSLKYNAQSAQLPGIKPSVRTLPPSTVGCFETFCAALRRRSTTSFAASRQVKNRHPRFGQGDSFVYPQSGFRPKATNAPEQDRLLPCPSRPIEGTIKTCTIKREADGWLSVCR